MQHPHETCWTVLRAATKGDPSARSMFAHNYMGMIRDILRQRWRGSPLAGEIDDAVQEVFVECIKPGGVMESADPARGNFRGLLYGVVRNAARRFEERLGRRKRGNRHDSVQLEEIAAPDDALSRVFDRTWARALLREAILRHAAEARSQGGDYRRRYRVLRFRHQRGLPIRKIAERLSEPNVEAVHNEYRRARREFRAILHDVVAAHTGARGEAIENEAKRLIQILG